MHYAFITLRLDSRRQETPCQRTLLGTFGFGANPPTNNGTLLWVSYSRMGLCCGVSDTKTPQEAHRFRVVSRVSCPQRRILPALYIAAQRRV